MTVFIPTKKYFCKAIKGICTMYILVYVHLFAFLFSETRWLKAKKNITWFSANHFLRAKPGPCVESVFSRDFHI